MLLEGLLAGGDHLEAPDRADLTDDEPGRRTRLARALRRRLERMREPQVFHPIHPNVPTGYPAADAEAELARPDVAARHDRRRAFDANLRRRLAKKIRTHHLSPHAGKPRPLASMKAPGGVRKPTDFSGVPPGGPNEHDGDVSADRRPERKQAPPAGNEPIQLGDDIARLARRRRKQNRQQAAPPASE